MNTIRFSHNWNNKLNCKIFSTIRKSNAGKRKYYTNLIGEIFEITRDTGINPSNDNYAILRDVKERRFSSIDNIILILDTGSKDIDEAKEIFKKFRISGSDNVLILLFEKI